MVFQVEFSHMHQHGQFKPVMHQSFPDLKTACDYAERRVMESPKGDRLCATVTGENGRIVRRCWFDENGQFHDSAPDAVAGEH